MIDLFDFEASKAESEAAKKAAMEQVEENANQAWNELMLEQVRLTAMEKHQFTSDDVMDRYLTLDDPKPVTHELRAMGPVLVRAAKAGYCRKAEGAVSSRRRASHAGPRAVWISLIWEF
jgi:hypothetical protein